VGWRSEILESGFAKLWSTKSQKGGKFRCGAIIGKCVEIQHLRISGNRRSGYCSGIPEIVKRDISVEDNEAYISANWKFEFRGSKIRDTW
jgi:hypothetical protein